MARSSRLLIVGVGSHAVAIDPTTGTEIWRVKLKTSSYVTVWQSGGRVFAGAGGELFCLDAASGTRLWHTKRTGLGMGIVAFTGSDDVASMSAAAAAAAAAGATAAC